MNTYFKLVCISFVTLVASACAAPAEPEAQDSAGDELRVSVLVGDFALHGTQNDTPFNSITLSADHTFKAQGGCHGSGGGAAHCFAITAIHGTWKTTTSGPQLGHPQGAPQIELTDSFHQVTTYFYSLTSDQLALRKSFNGPKSVFDKDVSSLPKLHSFDVCADKFDNSLGVCPEDLPCEFDGPDSHTQRCLPPI
jgi:hypothetical protein